MTLLRSFPLMTFVLVLLSIGALSAAQESLQLLLVAGTLAAISWYVTEGPRGRILPKWVSNLLVIGVALNVGVDYLQHRSDPLGVLGRFAIWLTLIKLYERRTARDHAQLMLLSLLLMITGCLQSADLIFGAILLTYCVLGLYVLLLYQLEAAFEKSRDLRLHAARPGYPLSPMLRPITGRRVEWHFRLQATGIALTGAAISMLAFILIPREVGADMLGGIRFNSRNRQTQYTNSVDLLSGGRINQVHRRVMTVQLIDWHGQPIKLDEPLHLRGGVCDRYEGLGRWRPAVDVSRTIALQPLTFAALSSAEIDDAQVITQHVEIVGGTRSSFLFSQYAPIAVNTWDTQQVQYDLGTQTLFADNNSRLNSYSVRVKLEPTDDDLQELTSSRRQGIPSRSRFQDPDGRVQRLAREVLAKAGIQLNQHSAPQSWSQCAAAAAAFTRYLQSDQYTYTLDLSDQTVHSLSSDPAQDQNRSSQLTDPITLFLLDTRRGHCEFFASGLAAMCQCVGIPARIATGYIATQYDPAAERYDVLQSNAHAWVEVQTGPYRWTTFDPTPPAVLADHPTPVNSLADQFRSVYQQFEGGWSGNIIAFDATSQDRLVKSLDMGWSKRLTNALESLRSFAERVNMFFNVGPGGYIYMGFVGVVLVIAVMALTKLMRRSIAIRRVAGLQYVRGREYQRMLRQLGFYVDLLQMLKRANLVKPDWQPPLAFAHGLAQSKPNVAAGVREFTELF
jgi:hypothetical protein